MGAVPLSSGRRVISLPYLCVHIPSILFAHANQHPQSEFEQYIEQLGRIVRQACPTCRRKYCIACGEPISAEKIQRPNAAAGDEPLFHCSNLQGVILGIGLSMLEQVYADVLREPAEDQDKTRTTKKRKMDTATSPSQPSTAGDDEDDMYWGAMGHSKGKKAKGGTGYAGDVKEDVST
jgi:hypothetical protein